MSEAKECTPLRRAIAIDFDGCLCKPGAWPGIGAPNWRVIEAALKERADGAALILWTCREGDMLQQALDACKGWGLEFDAVNQSGIPCACNVRKGEKICWNLFCTCLTSACICLWRCLR